jgi:hypothetical protein
MEPPGDDAASLGNEVLTLLASPFHPGGGGFKDAGFQTHVERRCEEIPHGNSGARCRRCRNESRLFL